MNFNEYTFNHLKITIMKSSKKMEATINIEGLTPTQYSIILDIVHTVQDIMTWDEDIQEYTDHDNFILSLSEEEYQELQRIHI